MGSSRWTIAEYVGMKDFPRNSPAVWPRISIWQKVTGNPKKPYEIRLRPDPVERLRFHGLAYLAGSFPARAGSKWQLSAMATAGGVVI